VPRSRQRLHAGANSTSPRALTGRRVKAARVLSDVSLLEAARRAGLSYQHLASVERGEHPLTASDALDLSAALNVPASWLRDGWS
jgi:transcriptional regulator with XRE-family HTH domain